MAQKWWGSNHSFHFSTRRIRAAKSWYSKSRPGIWDENMYTVWNNNVTCIWRKNSFYFMNRSDIVLIFIFNSNMNDIRLTQRIQQPNWIHINTHSIGCSSRVGMKGGRQDIRAGGCLGEDGSFGKLAHEVMHSLGLYYIYTFYFISRETLSICK